MATATLQPESGSGCAAARLRVAAAAFLPLPLGTADGGSSLEKPPDELPGVSSKATAMALSEKVEGNDLTREERGARRTSILDLAELRKALPIISCWKQRRRAKQRETLLNNARLRQLSATKLKLVQCVRLTQLANTLGSTANKDKDRAPRQASGTQQTLVGGIVTDFLHRCMKASASKSGGGIDSQETILKVISGTEKVCGYEYATTIVSRERLRWCLMVPITASNKQAGTFPNVGLGRVKLWANQIRSIKREVMMLRVEVDNFLLTSSLLRGAATARDGRETFNERRKRLDEFWGAYHAISRDRSPHRASEEGASGVMMPHGHRDQHKSGAKFDPATGGCRDAPGCEQWALLRMPPDRRALAAQRAGQVLDKHSSRHGPVSNGSGCKVKVRKNKSHQVLPEIGAEQEFGTRGPRESGRGTQGSNNSQGFKSSQDFKGTAPSSMGQKSVSLPSLPTRNTSGEEASSAFDRKKPFKEAQRGFQSRPCMVTGASGSNVRKAQRVFEAEDQQKQQFSLGRVRHLQECDQQQKLPLLMHFTTGHTASFDASGQNLVDGNLLTIVSMLKEHTRVESVNLKDNALLTDRSLVPFLQQLTLAAKKLKTLDLSQVRLAGRSSQEAIISLLESSPALSSLDLSKMPMRLQHQVNLCEAIGRHPRLAYVSLADTGLVNEYTTYKCIEGLFASRTVTNLDLSWNCFSADTFACLGEQLDINEVVRYLSIANCSAAVDPRQTTPVSTFLEWLVYDTDLKRLDISTNRIDFRCALILEDCLEHHKKLVDVNLSENPLGKEGMRHVLRLLARDNTGLMFLDTEGCYTSQTSVSPDEIESQVFNNTNPGRYYVLDLRKPYHRSILRMLYKTMDRFGLGPDDSFKNVKYSKPPYEHPRKTSQGVWQVQKAGELRFTFCIEKAIEAKMRGVADSDFGEFLSRYFEMMRFKPSWKKATPLFARWKQLKNRSLEQRTYVTSFARDFNLTMPYLEYMCQSSGAFAREAIWKLSPCTSNDTASLYMTMMLFSRFSDLIWTRQRVTALWEFNVENPTGHYHLILDNCADCAVAERLLLLDRWEVTVNLRLKREDTSQHGNQSQVRNETYQNVSLHHAYASIAEWSIPERGELVLDYASSQRPLGGAATPATLSEETWEGILGSMYDSRCEPKDKIAVLRSISHYFYLTSMHMRHLLGYFREVEDRAEVFVIFYPRIVDMHNSKLFRVCFEHASEVRELQDRLGYASFFPFLQPENAKFELDLSFYDQRLCMSMVVNLARKENLTNLREPEISTSDGTIWHKAFQAGIPPSWKDVHSLPRDGRFTGTYTCAPEHRNFAFRKQLAETYGYFPISTIECEDVLWWTGLLEVPEDMLDFLKVLIIRGFSCINEAFDKIREVGTDVITLRNIEEWLVSNRCKRFLNKDPKVQHEGIVQLFRHLDTRNVGAVTQPEFAVLGQLWNEFELSVKDFVYFLTLAFGENLEHSWQILDCDGSGQITSEEWVHAVKDIGYFGPSEVVFHLLDTSDDGEISWEEFQVLQRYHENSAKKNHDYNLGRSVSGLGYSETRGASFIS